MYFWVFSYGECSLQKGYRKGIFFWVANNSNIFGVLGIPDFYPPTKSEGYSFGGVRPFCSSIHPFCLSGTIS